MLDFFFFFFFQQQTQFPLHTKQKKSKNKMSKREISEVQEGENQEVVSKKICITNPSIFLQNNKNKFNIPVVLIDIFEGYNLDSLLKWNLEGSFPLGNFGNFSMEVAMGIFVEIYENYCDGFWGHWENHLRFFEEAEFDNENNEFEKNALVYGTIILAICGSIPAEEMYEAFSHYHEIDWEDYEDETERKLEQEKHKNYFLRDLEKVIKIIERATRYYYQECENELNLSIERHNKYMREHENDEDDEDYDSEGECELDDDEEEEILKLAEDYEDKSNVIDDSNMTEEEKMELAAERKKEMEEYEHRESLDSIEHLERYGYLPMGSHLRDNYKFRESKGGMKYLIDDEEVYIILVLLFNKKIAEIKKNK